MSHSRTTLPPIFAKHNRLWCNHFMDIEQYFNLPTGIGSTMEHYTELQLSCGQRTSYKWRTTLEGLLQLVVDTIYFSASDRSQAVMNLESQYQPNGSMEHYTECQTSNSGAGNSDQVPTWNFLVGYNVFLC